MPANQLFDTVASLLSLLFDREEAGLTKREEALIQRNISLGGSTDGFRHLGFVYTQLTGYSRRLGKYGTLHRELLPEMGAIRSDREILIKDRDRIRQAMTLVLRDCRTFQDMRDALPNGVKELVPELSRLPRTRPEAFTLADNPRSYTQYMAIREKIEFYVATRLLY